MLRPSHHITSNINYKCYFLYYFSSLIDYVMQKIRSLHCKFLHWFLEQLCYAECKRETYKQHIRDMNNIFYAEQKLCQRFYLHYLACNIQYSLIHEIGTENNVNLFVQSTMYKLVFFFGGAGLRYVADGKERTFLEVYSKYATDEHL